jgi:hypothetical protein
VNINWKVIPWWKYYANSELSYQINTFLRIGIEQIRYFSTNLRLWISSPIKVSYGWRWSTIRFFEPWRIKTVPISQNVPPQSSRFRWWSWIQSYFSPLSHIHTGIRVEFDLTEVSPDVKRSPSILSDLWEDFPNWKEIKIMNRSTQNRFTIWLWCFRGWNSMGYRFYRQIFDRISLLSSDLSGPTFSLRCGNLSRKQPFTRPSWPSPSLKLRSGDWKCWVKEHCWLRSIKPQDLGNPAISSFVSELSLVKKG